MSEHYNFSACREKAVECIFGRHCQLADQLPRCPEILSFIGLLSQNSHHLELLNRKVFCFLKAKEISLYSCFRYQTLNCVDCGNCQEPGKDFLRLVDLQQFLPKVRQEIVSREAEARAKFTITARSDPEDLAKFSLNDHDQEL